MKKPISHPGYPRVPIVLLLIVITVLFKNCEAPEAPNQVDPARQWFEKNKGTEWDAWPKVSEVRSIDWSLAVTNGQTIEVPVRLQEDLVGHIYDGKESIKGKISVRLVLWPRSDGYEAVVFEFVHVGGKVPRHLGEFDQSEFSGMIRASYGATKKYASLFDRGKQYGRNNNVSTGRLQTEACLYFIYTNTSHIGEATFTWLEYELQYCYDITAPQAPLPPDGGGWVLDYSGGGGGTTNWNPGFPENAQNGDIYEIHEPSGKIVRYRYNSSAGGWEWDAITLPVALITMYEYPFLFNVPTSLVIISDGIEYSFDEGSSSWLGTLPQVINNIQNPCVKNLASSLTNSELANRINEIINNVFSDTNSKVNVILNEDNTLPTRARTQVTSEGNPFNVTITVNATWLSASSQEYIADVIYHEAIHAYLDATGYSRDQLEQHVEIATNYVSALQDALLELFPNLPTQDAIGLSLRGLNDVMENNPSYWNSLLNSMGYSSHEQLLQQTNPYQAGTNGMPCN